jgi:hypothetical protein
MLRGQPVDPRDRQPSLPAHAGAAIMRALRPSVEERFQLAQEFGQQLLES